MIGGDILKEKSKKLSYISCEWYVTMKLIFIILQIYISKIKYHRLTLKKNCCSGQEYTRTHVFILQQGLHMCSLGWFPVEVLVNMMWSRYVSKMCEIKPFYVDREIPCSV